MNYEMLGLEKLCIMMAFQCDPFTSYFFMYIKVASRGKKHGQDSNITRSINIILRSRLFNEIVPISGESSVEEWIEQ